MLQGLLPTLHGSVSKAKIPDSEAEAESEAGGSGRKRVGIAVPKKPDLEAYWNQ